MVASCSDDKSIRVFDERTGDAVCTFHEAKGYGTHLAFHPSGTCIGVATSDKKVKVYDIRMQKLQQLYSSHEGPVTQVSGSDSVLPEILDFNNKDLRMV